MTSTEALDLARPHYQTGYRYAVGRNEHTGETFVATRTLDGSEYMTGYRAAASWRQRIEPGGVDFRARVERMAGRWANE